MRSAGDFGHFAMRDLAVRREWIEARSEDYESLAHEVLKSPSTGYRGDSHLLLIAFWRDASATLGQAKKATFLSGGHLG